MINIIRESWSDKEALGRCLLELCERQLSLAELIASQEQLLNNTFITEREDAYKGTDSMAKAKAKALVGTSKIEYEYEFEALNNLIKVVTFRISQI